MTDARPGKTLYLHIGAEKTGTTALQRYLLHNRDRLQARGFYYPEAGCVSEPGNHVLLSAAFVPESRRSYLPQAYRRLTRDELLADLRKELGSIGDEAVILSNEHLHTRVWPAENCRALVDFLRSLGFDDIRLVAYLRRQDELIESAFGEAIRDRNLTSPEAILDEVRSRGYWFNYGNYASLLEQWSQSIPLEQMSVRIYDRATLHGGSVQSDFLELLGISDSDDFEAVAALNRAWPAEVVLFLRQLCAINPELLHERRQRRQVAELVMDSNDFSGRHVFSPEQRAEIREAFAESNAMVAQHFAPEPGAELFAATTPDDGAPAATLDTEQFVSITSKLLGRLAKG